MWGCTLGGYYWAFVRTLLGASCVEESSITKLDGWMDGRKRILLLDTPPFFF